MLARLPRGILRTELAEHRLDLSLALTQLPIEQVKPGHEHEHVRHARLDDSGSGRHRRPMEPIDDLLRSDAADAVLAQELLDPLGREPRTQLGRRRKRHEIPEPRFVGRGQKGEQLDVVVVENGTQTIGAAPVVLLELILHA